MRVFVRLRRILASNKELARRLDQLEAKYAAHDKQLAAIVEAIRQLMAPPPVPEKKGQTDRLSFGLGHAQPQGAGQICNTQRVIIYYRRRALLGGTHTTRSRTRRMAVTRS